MAVSASHAVALPRLLALLADGRLRSGAWLAQRLASGTAGAAGADAAGATRVREGIEHLRGLNLEVQSVPGRGYRLAQPLELLDAERIRAQLAAPHRARVRRLEVLFDVDSTNPRLFDAPPPPGGSADVCLSELQHAGRGRRGRRWISPFGASLALSLSWTFGEVSRSLPALSLAVGVAVWRALMRAGATGVTLKWPNDIWFRDHKIGGVLIELRAETAGPAHVVVGVGLNVTLPPAARAQIDATAAMVAAVADACATTPSRNVIAGAIVDELLSMLGQFEREGFAAFRDAWTSLDALRGRSVHVVLAGRAIAGTARGVDEDGALLLETPGRVRRFVSGEASLRVQEGAV
jgi:BirA family biotin operon repressor/biotin-[acetyl-CoA-carboxylase] ligase